MVSEKALLLHSQKCSRRRASRYQIEQYRGLQEGSPVQIFVLKIFLTLFAFVPDRSDLKKKWKLLQGAYDKPEFMQYIV